MRRLSLFLLPLLLVSCRQVADVVFEKKISPAVVEGAKKPASWYSYMPERAPYFCLCTEKEIIWREPGMNLGYWQGLHPQAPHRVLMEAQGDTFKVHRHYVWDGMTVGETLPRDLYATLRHDALYHALKEGATFSRAEADRAFLRDMRREGVPGAGMKYRLTRWFGGFYLKPDAAPTMLLRPLPAPLVPVSPHPTH